MLTYEDLLAMSPLSEEEIAAIARHEHIPEIVALELGSMLHETPDGRRQICRMVGEQTKDAPRSDADIGSRTSQRRT